MTTIRWLSAGKTDPGLKRRNNEDSLLVDDENGIFIIADGMGGHSAGEVASALAVQTVHDALKESLSGDRRTSSPPAHLPQESGRDDPDRALRQILLDALLDAHHAIRKKAATDPALAGMGTTLVEMIIRDGRAYICHSGDSRAYLFRVNLRDNYRESQPDDLRENLRQLTSDHTVGEYLVATEGIPRDKVPPRQWHILTQGLGTENDPSPDFNTLVLQHGDMLLLCTDGLTAMLPDAEIATLLKTQPDSPGKLAERLITEANAQGGRDNISLILVRYE